MSNGWELIIRLVSISLQHFAWEEPLELNMSKNSWCFLVLITSYSSYKKSAVVIRDWIMLSFCYFLSPPLQCYKETRASEVLLKLIKGLTKMRRDGALFFTAWKMRELCFPMSQMSCCTFRPIRVSRQWDMTMLCP